mgnify:FL=1
MSEYVTVLRENRKQEVQKEELDESGMTSPLGATSTEEIRIFNEYMDQANLLSITKAAPEKKKNLF